MRDAESGCAQFGRGPRLRLRLRPGVRGGVGGRFISVWSADALHCSLRSEAAPCTLSPSSPAFWPPVSFEGSSGLVASPLPGPRNRAVLPRGASPSAPFPGSAWRSRALRRRRLGLVSEGTCSRVSQIPSGDDWEVRETACPVCAGFVQGLAGNCAASPRDGGGGRWDSVTSPAAVCPCPGGR